MTEIDIVPDTDAGTVGFQPAGLTLVLPAGQSIGVVFRNLDAAAAHRVLESFDGAPPVLKFVLMEVRGDIVHSANMLIRGVAAERVFTYSCASHPESVCTIRIVPNGSL